MDGLCNLHTNQPGIPECSWTHPVEQHRQVLEFLPVHRLLYIHLWVFPNVFSKRALLTEWLGQNFFVTSSVSSKYEKCIRWGQGGSLPGCHCHAIRGQGAPHPILLFFLLCWAQVNAPYSLVSPCSVNFTLFCKKIISGCAGSSLLRSGLLSLQREGYSVVGVHASRCGGLSRCGAQAPGCAGFIVAARGLSSFRSWALESLELSCLVARGIFSDQELNLCPLYWQADC